MLDFNAHTTIQAPAETIWRLLTDVSTYPDWDPTCERIEGTITHGGKLKVYSTFAPGRAFRVKVSELTPPTRMVWTGGMPFGLFKGVRTFDLAPAEGGARRFDLREVFDGPMLPLVAKSLPDLTEAFRGFCAGLKARAEAAAHAGPQRPESQ